MDLLPALLQDIEANPGDETPWLVLADWLDDQGEAERAELTRLSLELRRPGWKRHAKEERLRTLVAGGVTLPLPRRKLVLAPRVKLELVLIPPGVFRMGSPKAEERRDADEGPVHKVRLTRGFWMGVHPVTQAQWKVVVGDPPGRFRGRTLPVDRVSRDQCEQFLRRLSARTERPCRLPTEAEWEYACRGCSTTPFAFGSTVSSDQANFDGNYPYGGAPAGVWLEHTTPVGSYAPNLFGLYDMHGNVWEWCNDRFDEDYYRNSPAADPPGPATGDQCVLRGGSWYSYGWSCRSAGREHSNPESGVGNYGCRVAMDA